MIVPWWVRYGLAFLAGVALALLWHGFVMRGELISRMDADKQYTAEIQRIHKEYRQKIADSDTKYTLELSNAEKISRQLSVDLASGAKRLSIRAACNPVPEADHSGMGDGGVAVLDRFAQQAYRDHRALIEKKDAQIRMLQSILK